MTTAFQPSAFQLHAFQIDDTTDTHDGADTIPRKFHLPIYIGEGHRKQELSNIIRVYDQVKSLGDTNKLLAIVEPFVEAQSEEDLEKRAKTQRIVEELPPIERININNLIQNQMAIDRLLNEIERIKAQLAAQNAEDDMLLILISACV